jgi:small-conductance mechanosensitive channel
VRNHRIDNPVDALVQGLGDLISTANTVDKTTNAGAPVQGSHLFGVTLIGATPENLHKLVLTIAFIAIAVVLTWLLRRTLGLFVGTRTGTRFQFWAKQGVSLVIAAILILGIMSIWFDNSTRLASVLGLIGAGVAFALQRVITAVAGYFVILRGKTFNVGDRIVMGGVRGDVLDLSFMQTQIMEMGQPPQVEPNTQPAMWVHSRQFTGRIVTVTNDKIFDEPVYNYTHLFPYIWDEINLPVRYQDDRSKAEQVLREAAERHAVTRAKIGDAEVKRLEDEFGIGVGDIDPQTYWRITDNWLEVTVRFLAPDHGIRRIKDRMSRDILAALDQANIGIASGTYAIVEMPPLKVTPVDAPS